ncbi:MAG: glycoside hydrolase family 57 protein [Sulfuricaulis sp.]|nr:glycoside hydrolase family 57 protein [Sulfuricaulis sp.]
MADADRLKVVLCWHMHQPQYRDQVSDVYRLPWTYLHTIKDYVDMAAHLEAVPGARAVVNFAPLLLEQIEDYARQVDGFLNASLAIRDPLLAALVSPALPSSDDQRMTLIKECLRANETRVIARFPAYRRLADMAAWVVPHPESMRYLSNQFLADLLAWYHLAWLGETVRRGDARVRRLLDKETGYSLHDRRELLSVIGELLSNVISRYAHLAARGQVELSVTPYAHPILPLLLDFQSAREAMPEAPLPLLERYPGGEERVRWHIREGLETFRRHFGFVPAGCWPSEGAVSTASLKLLAEAGFRWAASGESVLRNSLAQSGHAEHGAKEAWLYRLYSVADSGMNCFFRDDGLSDLIGFTYASWHGDDAVNNLVHHLENISRTCRGHPDHVVSIIMDGENAWEHYPENAYYFLSTLYRRLSEHPQIELTTFADCLKTVAVKSLRALTTGSWVYGTLSTWIGEPDKNRGWDMLGNAKRAFDVAAGHLGPEQLERARRQLAVCEGSDWFWWFGGDNPVGTVADFEQLYRQHLTNLYQLLGLEPPEYLAQVFTRGGGVPQHGGTMRPGQISTA